MSTEYTVTSKKIELSRGSRFTYRCKYPIETGELCLITIGGRKTVGRYFPSVAGLDWILQAGLLIPIAGKIIVEILGLVELLAA